MVISFDNLIYGIYIYPILVYKLTVALDWIIEFRIKPSTGASKAFQRFEVKTKPERVDSKNKESK